MPDGLVDPMKGRLFSPHNERDAGPFPRTLLLGYGNIDRQDDGVAWHILRTLAQRFGSDLTEFPQVPHIDLLDNLALHFELQLTPEMAELVSAYDRVAFIDAHTGRVEETIFHEVLKPEFVNSPFTHHLTPSTCLSLAETLYSHAPQAVLVSVRGYEFGFSRTLSDPTRALVDEAADWLVKWYQQQP